VKAMSSAKLHEQPGAPLPDNLFSLPPPAFVEAWATALGLSEQELTQVDRDNLVGAIRNGTSRLKVIDALHNRGAIPVPAGQRSGAHAIRRASDRFALIENLTRFAPDDDAAFLRYTFVQICDREPSGRERLELEFDLRRGLVDRAAVVKRIVAIAVREGNLALWDTLRPEPEVETAATAAGDQTCARIMPAGLIYDENGLETLTFVREVPGTGWMIGPDVLRQTPKTVDNGWAVHEGWLIVGPKRSLKPGRWRVNLDLVQPQDAIVDVDVVANSGLDVLQRMAICGPFYGSFCVEFRPEHCFSELRMSVREQPGGSPWLRPRNITMQRVT
jgi:hypothetical protein